MNFVTKRYSFVFSIIFLLIILTINIFYSVTFCNSKKEDKVSTKNNPSTTTQKKVSSLDDELALYKKDIDEYLEASKFIAYLDKVTAILQKYAEKLEVKDKSKGDYIELYIGLKWYNLKAGDPKTDVIRSVNDIVRKSYDNCSYKQKNCRIDNKFKIEDISSSYKELNEEIIKAAEILK